MKKHSVEWLKMKWFDGLYSPGECACCIDNFNPCGHAGNIAGCIPGYKHKDPRKGKGDNFIISESKNAPTREHWVGWTI